MKNAVYLGTSGWTYDHWLGRFYPADIPRRKWFEFFSTYFTTVELNASFYRIPTAAAVTSWSQRAPEHFVFSVKMSRLITHVKRLRNCDRELEWFFSVFEPLRSKIGIFLVQLPPSLKFDPERLEEFFGRLPPDARFAFEFRNPTWYTESTNDLLRAYGHSFCVHDMGGLASERVVTSDTVYIRFHGYQARYGGDYPDEALADWAGWIEAQQRIGKTVFGYFNNDFEGFAVKNCLTLRSLLGESIESPQGLKAA